MTKIHAAELYVLTLSFVLLLGGALAALFPRSRECYAKLQRPWWAPSVRTCAILWFVVYAFEAVAATIVRLQGEWRDDVNLAALVVFVLVQLVIALWTFVFMYSLAWLVLLDLVALVGAVVQTILFFDVPGFIDDDGDRDGRAALWAGWLSVPLLVWLVYLFFLFAYLWYNNREVCMRDICKQRDRVSLVDE